MDYCVSVQLFGYWHMFKTNDMEISWIVDVIEFWWSLITNYVPKTSTNYKLFAYIRVIWFKWFERFFFFPFDLVFSMYRLFLVFILMEICLKLSSSQNLRHFSGWINVIEPKCSKSPFTTPPPLGVSTKMWCDVISFFVFVKYMFCVQWPCRAGISNYTIRVESSSTFSILKWTSATRAETILKINFLPTHNIGLNVMNAKR